MAVTDVLVGLFIVGATIAVIGLSVLGLIGIDYLMDEYGVVLSVVAFVGIGVLIMVLSVLIGRYYEREDSHE